MNALNELVRMSIGFDALFDELSRRPNSAGHYPPHNIAKTDGGYVIEVATAGFSESELSVVVKDDNLIISGTKQTSKPEYKYQGIGFRDFQKEFRLTDTVKVSDANYTNGILSVKLNHIAPKSQSETIKINSPLPDKVLLQEQA